LLLSLNLARNIAIWLVYYELTVLTSGDIFVNAIVLGFAELTASLSTGMLIDRFGLNRTFRFLAMMSLLAHVVLLFELQGHGWTHYAVLYIGVVGGGGLECASYCIVERQSPPEKLGQTFQIVYAGSGFANFVTPLIIM
jgi:nitrate/nitrite transporter NarK